MTFISYAQNFEDVMLWRALKEVDKGFYIDIGAAWSKQDSVTQAFYTKGWTGVNIEPNKIFYKDLKKNRPKDINVNSCISMSKSNSDFYLFEDTGLSTLNKAIADKHLEKGFTYKISKVSNDSLTEILDKHITPERIIHFCKIDVEGAETEVIKSLDWHKYRPWIVLVEATLPLSQELSFKPWENILLDADYQFVYFDGLNRFYIATEHLEQLQPAFSAPPNVFDDFMRYPEYQLRNLVEILQQHINATLDEL